MVIFILLKFECLKSKKSKEMKRKKNEEKTEKEAKIYYSQVHIIV